MLQLYPVYLLWNRHKTLTGSLDPTHANATDKPCTSKETGKVSLGYNSFTNVSRKVSQKTSGNFFTKILNLTFDLSSAQAHIKGVFSK